MPLKDETKLVVLAKPIAGGIMGFLFFLRMFSESESKSETEVRIRLFQVHSTAF